MLLLLLLGVSVIPAVGTGGAVSSGATLFRQRSMNVWRSGFMRCRARDGPWGSHHEEARAEKCDISVAETVDVGMGGFGGGDCLRAEVEKALLVWQKRSWRRLAGKAVGLMARVSSIVLVGWCVWLKECWLMVQDVSMGRSKDYT